MNVFMNGITDIDFSILKYLQQLFSCRTLDILMPIITVLGNSGIIWVLCGFSLLFFKKYRYWGIILLLGISAGVLIGNFIMKPIIARPRPCWTDMSVMLLIKNPVDFSFPSGHTLSSTISAVILAKADRRFGYVAIPLAALIAFSRLYLYVHFPTDVIAGAVLGIIVGLGTIIVAERYLDYRKNRVSNISKLSNT